MDAVFFCVASHEQPDQICAALDAGETTLPRTEAVWDQARQVTRGLALDVVQCCR